MDVRAELMRHLDDTHNVVSVEVDDSPKLPLEGLPLDVLRDLHSSLHLNEAEVTEVSD